MPVITHADTPTFEAHDVTVCGLAAPSRGSTESSTFHLRFGPGVAGPSHWVTREEIFMVLSGAAVIVLDGEHHDLGPGDTVIVPPGVPFTLSNPGAEPFEAIAVLPAGGRAVIGGEPTTPPWTI